MSFYAGFGLKPELFSFLPNSLELICYKRTFCVCKLTNICGVFCNTIFYRKCWFWKNTKVWETCWGELKHKIYKQHFNNLPVWPICQSTSACRICATWRGMALSRRRLEWRPVACQNPEPKDRLVLLSGRDVCHDCHFWVQRVSLQGELTSPPAGIKNFIRGCQ